VPPHDALCVILARRDESPKQLQGDQLPHDLTQFFFVHRRRRNHKPAAVSATSITPSMVISIELIFIIVIRFYSDKNKKKFYIQ